MKYYAAQKVISASYLASSPTREWFEKGMLYELMDYICEGGEIKNLTVRVKFTDVKEVRDTVILRLEAEVESE